MGNNASTSSAPTHPPRKKKSSATSSDGIKSLRSTRSSSTGRASPRSSSTERAASPGGSARSHRLLPETPRRNGSAPSRLSPNSPRPIIDRRSSSAHLTSIQNQLILKSWKRSQRTGLNCVGSKTFMNIFRREPSLKKLFGLEGTAESQLKYDARFRAHASSFTRTIDFVVKNLDDMDGISAHVQDLGRKHVLFQSRGFKPQYWDIFAESLTECAIDWEGGVRCREAMAAWRILIAFVIDQMRLGFDRERALAFEIRKISMRSSSPSPAPPILMQNIADDE
uniref:Globin family profile domain-containing protein n=1 Tax=Plectus sambesii TaxID=2011161 RepID=A0A914XC63_9BILA